MTACLPFWALALLACSCSATDGSPNDPSATSVVPQHIVEPSPEMRQLAEQQCRDDATLEEGYVQAVDPNSGQQLLEYSVDCTEVDG